MNLFRVFQAHSWACLSLALLVIAFPVHAASVDFRQDIEPILIKRCSECHGPDAQKGKLRLDVKAHALKGGSSGTPLLLPGKSAESELIARVTSADPDEIMPAKGAPLTAEQIDLLKKWIDEGAAWPEDNPQGHWAFLKPVRPAVPPLSAASVKVRNEIDRFIVPRLEQEGLALSPEADRVTLIRRLSLDLIGLPPTPAEVDDFVKDGRTDAYERLVERLLASPHYGEHIARWWLDLARYADSNGYQVDLARPIWPYRDWVIRAFHENKPFDQFTIEQLAGDLLPNATLAQKVATGFNRNTKVNDEGGGDAEEYRTKAVKDRVATTATTWLGLTMMCAECHTHKYDPISQDEYYRFYAFFNNTADGGNYSLEPTVPVPAPPLQRQLDHLHRRIASVKRQLAQAETTLPQAQQAWEQVMSSRTNVWRILQLTKAVSTGGATLTNLADGSILSTGLNPIYDTVTMEAETDLEGITAVLLETLPDPSLPKEGPGRWKEGNFILDEFGMTIASTAAEEAPALVAFGRASADWEQEYYRAEHAVDRHPKTGWAIAPQVGTRHFLIAETKELIGYPGGSRLGFRFEHYHGNSHTIGRIRISVTNEKDPDALWPVPIEVQALLAMPKAARTTVQARELAAFYRTVSPEIRRLERELFRLNQREAQLAATKFSTLVMRERHETARPNYVHVRGNFLEQGKEVTPGVPAFLHALPASEPADRLTLARWLVDPENPLTARVTVNRLWERFFGTGLVKTSDDFGRQGEAPSHPDLLNWLATEFVRTGWDVRQMQKLMVLSATYRQSSAVNEKLLEKDAYNRLLARGPRFRLDAETIRDQALAVSGLLNPDVGGPSVYPVQPANLWKEIGFLRPEIGMDEWPVSEGPDLYRRGLYTFWRRVCTYPTFATFDAPSRDVCIARRPRTNTPLQALVALNDPAFVEAARAFAQRIMRDGGPTVDEQVQFAFRSALARPPTTAEAARLRSFYQQQLREFQRDAPAAEALLSVGPWARPAECSVPELAAWTMLANVLLNLDETLTKG